MMRLIHGDCLEAMRQMPDCSVDSIVCDPPYGIGFMGKGWDSAVPGIEWAAECLRVLKPGGHLVAFASTRTLHRLACAVEDAGFDIRDTVHWCYWSGFPKSLDVSKAIDKQDAVEEQQARRYRFTEWVRSTGITAKQIDEATGTQMGNHYTTHPTQPAVMTREHLDAVRHLVGPVPAWVEAEADRRTVESANFMARKSTHAAADRGGFAGERLGTAGNPARDVAHTDAARQWSGWGTALKPAVEPAVLARKPIRGTMAANVLRHGTGALNIDGCRIAYGDPAWPGPCDGPEAINAKHAGMDVENYRKPPGVALGLSVNSMPQVAAHAHPAGRWPANLYHCPKPSTAEREMGTEGLPKRGAGELVDRTEGSAGMDNPRAGAGRTSEGRANGHPTVKPVALMRWLCRLVTPPGGVVLDPFMGSGTCGMAAAAEGFGYIGVELDADYFTIANARVRYAAAARHVESPEPAPVREQVSMFG